MRYEDEEREGWTRPVLIVGGGGAVLALLLAMVGPGGVIWDDPARFGLTWEGTAALIGRSSLWLLLAGAFASLAGWAFAARGSTRAERALRRERDNLLRDLSAMALGEAGPGESDVARRRAEEALKGQLNIREARVAELEQALERARSGADDSAGAIAELQRRVERGGDDARDLERLRTLEQARGQQRLIDVQVEAPEPEPDQEDAALQAWRLRYFEQRVRYLENLERPEPPASTSPPAETVAPASAKDTAPEPDRSPLLAADWRAREAESRAEFLENELRRREITPATEPARHLEEPGTPFAANADVDMLLRWRLLYLERRVAHLQTQSAETAAVSPEPELAPLPFVSEAVPDPDRWKWRARYLEARVRHLEHRAPIVASAPPPVEAAPAPEPEVEPLPPPPSDRARRKPSVLASPRDGAPDDLTLIEGVSTLQQSTFYSIGIYHFDQIAAWTPENVAWIDNYLRLRGRIDEEEWIEQAAALAQELAGA